MRFFGSINKSKAMNSNRAPPTGPTHPMGHMGQVPMQPAGIVQGDRSATKVPSAGASGECKSKRQYAYAAGALIAAVALGLFAYRKYTCKRQQGQAGNQNDPLSPYVGMGLPTPSTPAAPAVTAATTAQPDPNPQPAPQTAAPTTATYMDAFQKLPKATQKQIIQAYLKSHTDGDPAFAPVSQ